MLKDGVPPSGTTIKVVVVTPPRSALKLMRSPSS